MYTDDKKYGHREVINDIKIHLPHRLYDKLKVKVDGAAEPDVLPLKSLLPSVSLTAIY